MDRGSSSRSPLYPLFPEWAEFMPSQHAMSRSLMYLFLGTSVVYFVYQKKLLPKPAARVVGKFLFWPTLPITLILRTGNLFTQVDKSLILGTAPVGFLGHPKHLYSRGVRGVVNMCTEYKGPEGHYADLGITQLRLPTVDHFEPSLEFMKDAVDFIDSYAKKGEKCYVHCKAGHGRAAAIALCWSIYTNPGLSAEECNKLLYSKRKVRATLYKQQSIKAFKEWVDKGNMAPKR